MNSPAQLFNALVKLSPTEKKEMLKKNADGNVLEAIRLALDPDITFGVQKYQFEEPCEHGEGYEYNLQVMYHALGKLSSREVTGNNALKLILDTSCQLDAEQQDVFKRILDKDLRCGVGLGLVQELFPKLVTTFDVMLAHKIDWNRIRYPLLVEPKLDGVRCLATVFDNKVTFLSRNGKPFENFNCFEKEIALLADGQNLMFDGEVSGINEDKAFKKVQQQARRKTGVDTSKLKYSVFDVLVNGVKETQNKRTERLKDMFISMASESRETFRVVRVKGIICNNEKEVQAFYSKCLDKGYEGVIVKSLTAPYQYKRTRDWSKIKPTDTEDLKVISAYEGEGKYKGSLGGLTVERKGVQTNVGGGYTDKKRKEFWQMHLDGKIAGVVIEVKFDAVTDDGSLRFPRFVKQRFDLD